SVRVIASTNNYTLSLHDALPIFNIGGGPANTTSVVELLERLETHLNHHIDVSHGPWRMGDQRYYVSDTSRFEAATGWHARVSVEDRKSTRLNSSHVKISYAVFCL